MANAAGRRWREWAGDLFRPEKLDALPEAPKGPARGSFFAWLLGAEILPLDEVVANRAQRESAPSGVFAAETLPLDAPPDRRAGRRSFFAILFSREQLPDAPAVSPGAASDPRR